MLRRTTLPVLAGLIGMASQATPALTRDGDIRRPGTVASSTERTGDGSVRVYGESGAYEGRTHDGRAGESSITESRTTESRTIGSHTAEPADRETGQAAAAAANQRGEAAYHGGDLDGAVALYLQAIELDPGNALSYSNLGLAYLKLGRATEAIWASRRAIALARGAGAASIRAGAYYNIGKLYEHDGQHERAMSHYLAARREKPDPTYDEALQRVSGY